MQGSEFKAQYSQKEKLGQAPVTHTCNPSYSRSRDQEDCSLKRTQIVLKTLSQKSPSQKGLAEWLKMKALHSSHKTEKEKIGQSW
jgi:hypothetical protein